MSNLFKSILCTAAAVAFTVVVLPAQDKGKAPAKAGVLQPQLTPEGGLDKSTGKLGAAPSQPWSATTVGASVGGNPNPGAAVKSVTGEIVDFSCYLQVGKHGTAHTGCAQKCFRAGQPIGLLTSDGSLYMLMEEEHDPRRDGMGTFRDAAIENAGKVMEVSGTSIAVNGFNALYVSGYIKK